MATWKYAVEEVKKIMQTCLQCGKKHHPEDCPYFITELSVESDALLDERKSEGTYA